MDALIPVLNDLQKVFGTVGLNIESSDLIQLPQIVVIGSQSSGKSSVLENIVGKDFLPRGVGIVTRCPLILQLVRPENETAGNDKAPPRIEEDYAVFGHCPDRVITDFKEVHQEIERETARLTNNSKNISSEPIFLRICSERFIPLTLVDLPGLTKIPIEGQPDDIEFQIKDLVIRHIANPNTIILVVTAANTDLSTSEALKLAREMDPEGLRTLGVLTKLDIMDLGTDAYDVLRGNVIKVKLGIIGVVNRSQKDIMDNKPISESIKSEAIFLRKTYASIADRHGTAYLSRTLNKLLLHHIRHCLPSLKTRLSEMLSHFQSISSSLGEDIKDKSRFLLQAINRFSTHYCATIEGTSTIVETDQLACGARICYIFHEMFAQKLKSINPLDNLTKQDILTSLRNSSGPRPALFVHESSFDSLVKRQINLLRKPSVRCVQNVHEELQRVVQHAGLQQISARFPLLKEKIVEVVNNLLRKRLPITIQMVENLIDIELAYTNTRHPDFHEAKLIYNAILSTCEHIGENRDGETGMPANIMKSTNFWECFDYEMRGNPLLNAPNFEKIPNLSHWPIGNSFVENSKSSKTDEITITEEKECDVIERLIISYFAIVRKNIQDSVPKAIMHFLVNEIKENVQSELVSALYKTEGLDELMAESSKIIEQRAEAIKMVDALQQANQIINEIREMPLL